MENDPCSPPPVNSNFLVADPTRRRLGFAVLGALGTAAFLDTRAARGGVDGSPEGIAAMAQTLGDGAGLAWVDTVLGLPAPEPPTIRTGGDLATKTPEQVGATVVIAKGCTVPGDGGGGLFRWAETGIDDGGTVIVPGANVGASGGCWKRVYSGPFDVKWFGARGNGDTDDRPAIQSAINAAWAVGGEVFFGPGEYVCYSPLALPVDANSSLALIGSGVRNAAHLTEPYGTRLRFAGGERDDFIAAIFTIYKIPVYRFENLSIIGPGATGATTSGNGIRISGTAVPRVVMSDVTVDNFPGGNGIWLDACEYSTLKDVFVSRCQTGLRLTGAFNANTLINVAAGSCSEYGIYAENSASVTLVGCTVQSNERTGFKGVNLIDWVISATHFENNNTSATPDVHAVDIESASPSAVQHMKFDNCTFFTGTGGRENIVLRARYNLVDLSFSGYANYPGGLEPAITVDPVDPAAFGRVLGLYLHEFCTPDHVYDPAGKISGLQLWYYGEHLAGSGERG